jgi:hypothetical protein
MPLLNARARIRISSRAIMGSDCVAFASPMFIGCSFAATIAALTVRALLAIRQHAAGCR